MPYLMDGCHGGVLPRGERGYLVSQRRLQDLSLGALGTPSPLGWLPGHRAPGHIPGLSFCGLRRRLPWPGPGGTLLARAPLVSAWILEPDPGDRS